LLNGWRDKENRRQTFKEELKMFKKTLLAAALATPLAAFAFPTTFDDTSLGGTHSVTFSQLQISGGGSTITLNDTDNSGTISGGDLFSETGMIAGVGFTNAMGNPIGDTGLNSAGGYELWAVFSPLVGYISNAAVSPGLATYEATFVTPSSVTIYYDTVIGDGFSGGTAIGTATSPSSNSTCTVTAAGTAEMGACLLNFAFDELGVSAPGVWTAFGGTDIGDLTNARLRVDLNIDNFAPTFFSPTFDVAGGTQVIDIDHNGSAAFVPEPGSLALMGLSMLGLFGATRRKHKAD
jgi:hypothetical protein